ncbi:MAG: hypothetical protein ABJL99_03990 [Aliishimia sp.]
MGASQSVPELVEAARSNAKLSVDRISDIETIKNGPGGTDAQSAELGAAIAELEAGVVDTFSMFEARMQHHFRRGPFSRKLTTKLSEAGEADLAERVHQFYLAVNVLKHGKGASYRELSSTSHSLIVLKSGEDVVVDASRKTSGLVDVTVTGFFEALSTTIIEAYQFLENK